MVSISDKELLARVVLRDASASAELFDRYAQEIFGFLARRMGPSEGEDLLQEVFLRVLYRASSFRGDSSVRTWLYSIARYALLEKQRARIPVETFFDLTEQRPGPESMALRGEHRKLIVAALENLPDHLAIVLELHRIDGLPHEEIATLLDISAAASRKRLERARAQLLDLKSPMHGQKNRYESVESWRDSLLERLIDKEALDDIKA